MEPVYKDSVTAILESRFAAIDFPEPTTDGDGPTLEFQKLAASEILAKVAGFLGEFAEFLPTKETVLAATEKAIELAFAQSPRPFLTNLIKPATKVLILDAVGSLYDSIASIGDEPTPDPTPEPRTEV